MGFVKKRGVNNSGRKLELDKQRALCSRLDLTQNHLPNNLYSFYIGDSLHLLYLEISENLKECTVACFSSFEMQMK